MAAKDASEGNWGAEGSKLEQTERCAGGKDGTDANRGAGKGQPDMMHFVATQDTLQPCGQQVAIRIGMPLLERKVVSVAEGQFNSEQELQAWVGRNRANMRNGNR